MSRARDLADRVLHNRTHEDTEGGRESIVTFKGEQSGGEISTLAQIQASHDGTSDDEKADLIFKTNDGSDGASPTERLRIDSAGSIIPATLGTSNVKFGLNAGKDIASGGNYNTLIGEESGASLSTGDVNTFVGYQSGDATTTSGNNVGVGYASLTTNILSSKNVAIGNNALKTHNLGSAGDGLNVAIGHGAGESITTGLKNTIVGSLAADAVTDGDMNVAIGHEALSAETGGDKNVAIGASALKTQNTNNAAFNTAVGTFAGTALTTGERNTFIGANAADLATTTDDSVCIGYNAGGGSILTGHDNVIIGKDAAFALTSGQRNVIIGKDACANSVALVGGQGNIMLGFSVRNNHINNDYCIGIGYNITTVGDNNFTFGRDASDSNIAFGATSITAPSDERYKEEIADSTAGLSFINDLRPVTFKWKKAKDVPSNHEAYIADGEEGCDDRVMLSNGETNHGFIAQEVKTAIDAHSEIKDGFGMWSEETREDADGNDITGGRQRVAPSELVPILTKAIQELSAKVDALESENTAIKARLDALEAE